MLKRLQVLAILCLFISCNEKPTGNKVENLKPIKDTTSLIRLRQEETATDTILHSDTAYVNKDRFTAIYTSSYDFFLLNGSNDTIYKEPDSAPQFEFADFNGDGYKDVRMHYMTNVPDIQNLLLYDKKDRTFKVVSNFLDFPAPQKINNTNYYYSYHRSGCADTNWDSDLFYIDNYQAIRIGNIAGYECENRDIKDGIYIFKISGNKENLVKRLPINILQRYEDYKWGFIKAYWTKNYKLFLK